MRPDCWIICFIIGHLQHWKCAQKYIEFANASQKVCQILNELFQNGQSFLTLCHLGEISTNLVTLVTHQPTDAANWRKMSLSKRQEKRLVERKVCKCHFSLTSVHWCLIPFYQVNIYMGNRTQDSFQKPPNRDLACSAIKPHLVSIILKCLPNQQPIFCAPGSIPSRCPKPVV